MEKTGWEGGYACPLEAWKFLGAYIISKVTIQSSKSK